MSTVGIRDLFESERGLFALLLVFIVTILLAIGKIDPDRWMDYTKWIAGTLIIGKSLTTAVDLVANRKTTPGPTGTPTGSDAKDVAS